MLLRKHLLSLVILWGAIALSPASAQEKAVVGLIPKAQKPSSAAFSSRR